MSPFILVKASYYAKEASCKKHHCANQDEGNEVQHHDGSGLELRALVSFGGVECLNTDVGPAFETGYDKERDVRLLHVVKVVVVTLPAAAGDEALLLGVQDVGVYRAEKELAHHEVHAQDREYQVDHRHDD